MTPCPIPPYGEDLPPGVPYRARLCGHSSARSSTAPQDAAPWTKAATSLLGRHSPSAARWRHSFPRTWLEQSGLRVADRLDTELCAPPPFIILLGSDGALENGRRVKRCVAVTPENDSYGPLSPRTPGNCPNVNRAVTCLPQPYTRLRPEPPRPVARTTKRRELVPASR